MTKPNNEWEKEILKLDNGKVTGIYWVDGAEYNIDEKQLIKFISKTLQQQREEIIKEIEGIVGEDEKVPKRGIPGWLSAQIRNQFRYQIKSDIRILKKNYGQTNLRTIF
jgi:hypothetical protein